MCPSPRPSEEKGHEAEELSLLEKHVKTQRGSRDCSTGQTWEGTTESPEPLALHLSKAGPHVLQKGMKAALALLGTQQLP